LIVQSLFFSGLLTFYNAASSGSFLGATIIHDHDAETLRLVDEGKLIHISRARLLSVAGNSITLSTGEKVPSDAIVFCTGWEMAIPPLFRPPLAKELGLAVDRANLSEEETRYWQSLEKAAEDEFLELYPIFKDPPNNIHIPSFPLTPFCLLRTLAPPQTKPLRQTFFSSATMKQAKFKFLLKLHLFGESPICKVFYPRQPKGFYKIKRKWTRISRGMKHTKESDIRST
jgi:hypothetical protein